MIAQSNTSEESVRLSCLNQIVWAVRVKIERVCAFFEQNTLFYPDDQ